MYWCRAGQSLPSRASLLGTGFANFPTQTEASRAGDVERRRSYAALAGMGLPSSTLSLRQRLQDRCVVPAPVAGALIAHIRSNSAVHTTLTSCRRWGASLFLRGISDLVGAGW